MDLVVSTTSIAIVIVASANFSALTLQVVLACLAAAFSLALALPGILRKRHNLAMWSFAFGMAGLAADAIVNGFALTESDLVKLSDWRNIDLAIKVFLTSIWLCFSVVYSRGSARESFRRWLPVIAISVVLPITLMVVFPDNLIQAMARLDSSEPWLKFWPGAKAVNLILLIGAVLILMNLERTFRAAVGTMQWRIKFLILGLAVIFGARIYTRSQVLVFSGHSNPLTQVETIALLIGCCLITIGYARSGFNEIDVYPSRAVLRTSITVLLAGSYLFVIGVLAQVVAWSGGPGMFQLQALLVLLGVVLLAVLLLSERLRQRVNDFITHHFKRPHYDASEVWRRFTRSTSAATDDNKLCAAAASLISETFSVMSVSIWLYDEEKERLLLGASTSHSRHDGPDQSVAFMSDSPDGETTVFDLEKIKAEWGGTLREISGRQFSEGGHRVGIFLRAAESLLGVAILADRVSGVPYTAEEFELLKCVGDQVASNLLNLRLTQEIMLGKELEAFQTISAFFVHDLKNAASTLKLTLQNLPVHFDDPDFRQDTLQSIGATTNRINQIIERLGTLGGKLELRLSPVDLNLLVEQAIENVNGMPGIEFAKEIKPLPTLMADSEQLRSVVTNLLLNARDAVGERGRIEVKTDSQDGWAALSVSDDGCGMTPSFLRDSLFRPFKTTKKKGLGIGMFQSKMIIEAHHGSIRVKSDVGKGTTFQVLLPLTSGK